MGNNLFFLAKSMWTAPLTSYYLLLVWGCLLVQARHLNLTLKNLNLNPKFNLKVYSFAVGLTRKAGTPLIDPNLQDSFSDL